MVCAMMVIERKNDAPSLYTENGAKGDKVSDIPLCSDIWFRKSDFPSHFPA